MIMDLSPAPHPPRPSRLSRSSLRESVRDISQLSMSCGIEDSQVVLPPPQASSVAQKGYLTRGYAVPRSPRKASPQRHRPDRFMPAKNTGDGGISNGFGTRILEYGPEAPSVGLPADLRSQLLFARATAMEKPMGPQARTHRKIPRIPETILDAPGILDDYYLNLVDWSQSNHVAIGLGQSVYVWNAVTGAVVEAAQLPDHSNSADTYVASVRWSEEGYLAVGSSDGDIQIWDVEHATKLRTMRGRTSRVSSLAWSQATLSSGARDGGIWHHDVRIRDHKTAELWAHAGEVCGLAWRPDGSQLASGGNDNTVHIWDARVSAAPRLTKTHHTAAVKAVAWCPWQASVLATGGGSLDRHIHMWNTTTGARLASADTGSQVTSVVWNENQRELASCHGYPNNSISVWSYPSLTRIAEIEAHETRILHATLSPNGQMLATCAADENLKFWKLFDAPRQAKGGVVGKGATLR